MTYLSGYLQRDVSIRNVLMAERPVRRKAFKVPEGFLAHLSSLEDELLVAKIRALCNRVEQLVAELGIWKDCFSEENQETKSVGHSQDFSETTSDETHRVHPSLCPVSSRSQQN